MPDQTPEPSMVCQNAMGGGLSAEPWDDPDCYCPDCRDDADEMRRMDEEAGNA